MILRTEYKKILQKTLVTAMLCFFVIWAPVWVFAPVALLAMVFIPRYFAVCIPFFLYDILYSAPVPLFLNIPFVISLCGVFLFTSIEFLRTRVFVNELL